MALSSRTITASINYRCAPFSATLMHRGRRAALKTPSDACAEDCRGKLIWPRCPINACSPWCVPIITLPESVLTTKPRQRFSAVTCCTSNVNPPSSDPSDDRSSRQSAVPDHLCFFFGVFNRKRALLRADHAEQSQPEDQSRRAGARKRHLLPPVDRRIAYASKADQALVKGRRMKLQIRIAA